MAELLKASTLPPLTDTEPVYCQGCESWFTPDASWRCPCGALAAYAVQPGTCPDCGNAALMVRKGNTVRLSLCRCTLTAEERLALEKRWRELDDAEKVPARPALPAAKPTLAEDAPVRDWWPPLAELLPSHIDRAEMLESVRVHQNDFPLALVVSALRRILERIRRAGTQVGSHRYLHNALSRELGSGERKPKAS